MMYVPDGRLDPVQLVHKRSLMEQKPQSGFA